MHLPPVSAMPVSAMPDSSKPEQAAGRNDVATGFDALLAALLPSVDADAAADLAANTLAVPLPAAEAATDAATPGLAEVDAVQSLLASLPPLHAHDPAFSVAVGADREPRTAHGDAAGAGIAAVGKVQSGDALLSGAPESAARKDRPLPERAGAASVPPSRHTTARDGMLADTAPQALPRSETRADAQGKMEQSAKLSELPAVFAAEQRNAMTTTELAARQAVLPVAPPLASPAWSRAFSEQVLWTARAELQSASLVLNPPELGPVKIELLLDDTQATASFSSAQPEVRKAMEEALPTLKALLAEAGIDLRHTDIGNGDANQRHGRENPQASDRASGASAAAGAPGTAAPPMARVARGLLDTFA